MYFNKELYFNEYLIGSENVYHRVVYLEVIKAFVLRKSKSLH